MESVTFNSFKTMPFIPYNIVSHLAQDPKADNLFKLLKYPSYDALSKPSLTLQEKIEMINKNQSMQNEYNIFLSRLIEDEQTKEQSILKIYKAETVPTNAQVAVVCYEFDIMCGAKTTVVDYDNIPVSRLDLMESIILESLNGADVNGVGVLQFNRKLTSSCRSSIGIGNNSNYIGTALVMGVLVSTLDDSRC